MTPEITGIHHLTFNVQNLESSIAWYGRVLGATHLERLDHHDERGRRYAVILQVHGLDPSIQLRLATSPQLDQASYDPVTLEVADQFALKAWSDHLETCGVEHTPATQRRTGYALEFTTPDAMTLRLYTAPVGDIGSVRFSETGVTDTSNRDPG